MSTLVDCRNEFIDYINSKSISSTIIKKFVPNMNVHIKNNTKSFIDFWTTIKELFELPVEQSIIELNRIIYNKDKGYETFVFISEWTHSYLGAGELVGLMLIKDSYSGGKRKPDILYKESNRKIEVKSYLDNFRLTESTSFFTDLGTIIQALVQGGFLTSLTDINNNDLRKGLSEFTRSFTSPRGYIELNSKIWKLESSDGETMIFKISPETSNEVVKYSVVRNSLRNWLGRGILSIQLAAIIDPTRTSRIMKKELDEYVANLLGVNDRMPIALEQYFILTGIESLLIYERKDKALPFKIYKQEDLSLFSIDRIGQSKVSYKKTNKQINKK
jgi:hypothetical protein